MLFCWNYDILYVHIYNLDLRFMASSVGSLRVPTVGFSAPFLDKPLTRNSHKTTKCVINLLKKNSSPYCVSHISLSEVQSLSPLIKNLVGGWPIHLKNMSSSDWIIIPLNHCLKIIPLMIPNLTVVQSLCQVLQPGPSITGGCPSRDPFV